MGFRRVRVLAVCALAACTAGAQDEDVRPRDIEVKAEAEKAAPAEAETPLFFPTRVAPLGAADRAFDGLDGLLPLTFGAETQFVSNWLSEGGNWAKNGTQIIQTYYTEYAREFGGASAGGGFYYYQVDTTWNAVHPSTLERDFGVYAPISWKKLSLEPYWAYVYVDQADDTGEFGGTFSLDVPLKPTFYFNHDYRFYCGGYYEWSVSHDINVAPAGERLFVFTPSMAMGMDSHKYQPGTTLTHIDWGLELGIPVMKHFVISGMLHFTKSLARGTYEEENDVFEDIIPWGGLKLTMEF